MFQRTTLSSLLLAATMIGCRSTHAEQELAGRYLVTSPLRKDTELPREYVAQIRAIQHIELRALERGYLQGIFVDEGKLVTKGSKMFQITPMLYQAEVQKSQAEAQLTEIEYGNTKLLADKQIVAPSELALSKAKVDKAKAELSLASTHKGMTEIRAPFEGIMGRFQVRLGSLVSEGDLLTTLSDNRTLWAYFNVSESEYLTYKTRREDEMTRPVKFVMANGEEFDQPGKIETIEADFNSETGNLAFRATFANPQGLLRHGETGKVRMTTQLKNALVIPQKATFEVLDKRYVFVIDEKNVVHTRPISVTAEIGQVYVVKEGLTEQDKVLVDGIRKVKDGAIIEMDYKSPAEVFAHLEVPVE